MSTKSSIILTTDNEHWYRELCAKHQEGVDCPGDECIVLEIDPKHRVETDEEGTRIIIKAGTELFKHLDSARFGYDDHKMSSDRVITVDGLSRDDIAKSILDAIKRVQDDGQ